jgi:hypothetical protein
VSMNRRKDRQTALIIDRAISTCSTQGVQLATMILSTHDIAHGTIMRVLTSPRQRRSAGQRSCITEQCGEE